jgi:hypothetical protein
MGDIRKMENFINWIDSVNTIPEAIVAGSLIIGIAIIIYGFIK